MGVLVAASSLALVRLLLEGVQPQLYVAVLAVTVGFLAPLLLRVTGSLQLAMVVLMGGGLSALMAIVWLEGGLGSQGMYWLALIPLLATVFGGVKMAAGFAVVALVMLAAIYKFPVQGVPATAPFIHVVSAALAIGFSWVLALLYERGRLRALEENQRLKDEFVAAVSHELRTPLTSIRGVLGLLEGGALGHLDDRTRELVAVAVRNSERLGHLIDDLLDLEKIQSGHLEYTLERTRVASTLQTIADDNATFARTHGVRLRVTEAPDAAVTVDRSRLQQVLTNLISNAIKHSPDGGTVTLSATVEQECVVLSVTDQGPGIPAEFQEQVFEKFARANASSARSGTGTGLGLAITKRIVEDFGGRIWFVSEAGAGTAFHVRLPRSDDDQAG